MNKLDIIRAWKDEEYRMSLSDEERSRLPAHPAGLIELGDADLESAAGGFPTFWTCGRPLPTVLMCPPGYGTYSANHGTANCTFCCIAGFP